MNVQEYISTINQELPKLTLCFLLRDNQVLLGRKKRGTGIGKWLGAGGKVEPGETVKRATIRETQEEFCITPHKITHIAKLGFYFPYQKNKKDLDQHVYAYLCTDWQGQAQETDEMKPQWFDLDQIPYDDMWPDSIHWLSDALNGQKMDAHFIYDQDYQIKDKFIIYK